MNHQESQARIQDYLDDALSLEEDALFEEHVKVCSECERELAQYRSISELEKSISEEKPALEAGFSVGVMDEVVKRRFLPGRFFERWLLMERKLIGVVGAAAVGVFALVVANQIDGDSRKLKLVKDHSEQKQQNAESYSDLVVSFKDRMNELGLTQAENERRLERVIEEDRLHRERVTGIFETLVDKFEKLAREVDSLASAMRSTQDAMSLPDRKALEGPDSLDSFGFGKKKRSSASDAANVARNYRAYSNLVAAFKNDIAASKAERKELYKILVEADQAGMLGLRGSSVAGYEQYGEYEENMRVQVREAPLSTFSIDVDTASYSNMRRFLSQGTLPPENSVRIEEFINYFDYSYLKQSVEPFVVYSEIAPAPFSEGRHLLKLGIRAKDIEPGKRTPWSLVFLIDVSGSMADDDKLPLLKRSLALLVDGMSAEDRLSIVTYSDSAKSVLESTSGANKTRILRAIKKLHADGGTNGESGIKLAYGLAEKGLIAKGVNRVILASDGDFNVGVSEFDPLMKLIEEKRKSGIALSVLGFGEGNLQDKTLEQLADRGNGNYFYIDSFGEARKVLLEDLSGNMEIVAKDVKLQIEFNPKHVVEYRLVGYDNRVLRKEDFDDDTVDAGEIGTGHTVTALYELTLAGSAAAKKLERKQLRYAAKKSAEKEEPEPLYAAELAYLKIRFKTPESEVLSVKTHIIPAAKPGGSINEASEDLRFAAAVSAFAHKLRGSRYAPAVSFSAIAKLAAAAKGEDLKGRRQEFIGLVENAKAIKP